MPIGHTEHGETNVLQLTVVFTSGGDVKGLSGYERDSQGRTFNQWREMAATELQGRAAVTEAMRWLSQRVAEISRGE